MHGVEASLAAADALPVADQEGKRRLRDQALRTTRRVVGWGRRFHWLLPEHFTADWTPLPDYNRDRPADPFRPYGATPGHLFEWARLATHLQAVTAPHRRTGRRARGPLRRRGRDQGPGPRHPLHRRPGRPGRRRRPHALGALRGDRGRLRAGGRHWRRRLPDLRRRLARGRGAVVRRPVDRELAPRAHAVPERSPAARGPASPTPTTWPRCCCSTGARCGGASRPRCAEAGPAAAGFPTYRASVTPLLSLADARFVSLTTFRRTGERVSTPVWVGRDDEALVVLTPAGSGKVRRLRHDPRVEVAPCGRFGTVGDGVVPVAGTAERAGVDRGRRSGPGHDPAALSGRVPGRPGDRAADRTASRAAPHPTARVVDHLMSP